MSLFLGIAEWFRHRWNGTFVGSKTRPKSALSDHFWRRYKRMSTWKTDFLESCAKHLDRRRSISLSGLRKQQLFQRHLLSVSLRLKVRQLNCRKSLPWRLAGRGPKIGKCQKTDFLKFFLGTFGAYARRGISVIWLRNVQGSKIKRKKKKKKSTAFLGFEIFRVFMKSSCLANSLDFKTFCRI